jgi:hypothetical protein
MIEYAVRYALGSVCVAMALGSGLACSSDAAPARGRGGQAVRDGGAAGSAGGAGDAGRGGSFGNADAAAGSFAAPFDAAMPIPAENCNQDVDVVFVLDVSGSMIPPLTRLEAEVAKVDAALQTKNLPSPPHYGLVIFVDDAVMMNGGAPYPDIAALRAAVAAEINTTNLTAPRQASASITEANFSWPENSLDALHAAATMFQWRPVATTLRTIIHVTDASFWDLDAVSSAAGDPMLLEVAGPGGCSNTLVAFASTCTLTGSTHSYDETVSALRDNSIWVNTFAARTGGPPGVTAAPASHGAFRGVDVNVGIGFHEPYAGKPSLADSTGGLAWDIDAVYDGVISLATPITEAIAEAQCMEYPPLPPPE